MDIISKAINYIKVNDNVSSNCALCILKKQAMRVIAGERTVAEATRYCFYSKRGHRPIWQHRAIDLMKKQLTA